MYIERLEVRNIKLLSEQSFSFADQSGQPRMWTVILAENGLCKSTILQLIGLLASGPVLSRQLITDPRTLPNANQGAAESYFSATFTSSGPGNEKLHPRMDVSERSRNLIGNADARFIDDLRGEELPGAFVVGYGVGRYLPEPGEVAAPSDLAVDRVEGLYRPQHKVLGVDFYEALTSISGKRGRSLARQYSAYIRKVLLSTDDTGEQLLPALNTFELRGAGGVGLMDTLLKSRRFEMLFDGDTYRLTPSSLSQGYQSTIAWICDLLGHAFLDYGRAIAPDELEGIALLDEVDLHLHPTWQRRLIPTLASVFPKLQFIVTTHSPLVLTGVDASGVIRLGLRDGRVTQLDDVGEPGLADASSLLNAYFGVPRAGRPQLVEWEKEYLRLAATNDNPQRKRQLEERLLPYWSDEKRLESSMLP